ncbi:hypothetical protein, partial [Cellulomonas bogoriensis]|uniref:hypothetical protein n=1 Tax=Cellulomonas bogoriensis TaxID=301388 RepID=UPI00055255FC
LFGRTVLLAARPRGTPLARPGPELDEALSTARLINIFVTCFDGVCDEAPELLPATLPYLDDLFARFPEPPPDPPRTGHPVVTLVHGSAAATARLLGAHVPEDLRGLAADVVRGAYRRQVESLRVGVAPTVDAREGLSVATFAVTLLVAAVWARLDPPRARALLGAARPVGALFGWVDDLVDLPVDASRGRPNMVAADPGGIVAGTAVRWDAVRVVPGRLRADGVVTVEDLDAVLLGAVWAWLGFPDGPQP